MVRLVLLGPPVVVGAVAFVLGWFTLQLGVGFWDTAELQAVAPLMGTAHPTGFPTYVILGWVASVILQPFGEPAFRMNLFSALSVAVAAGVTVDLVRVLSGSRWIGVATGLGLALTPQVWINATHAEAHTLHLALLAILLRLLVGWSDRRRGADAGEDGPDTRHAADRWLVAAAVVFALSVGNHSLTLLLVPPVALYVLAVEPRILVRPRLVLACVAALVITLVVIYLELPLRAGPFRAPLVYGRPETWDGFWYVVLAEQFRGSLVDPFGNLGGKLGDLVDLAFAEFGALAVLIPFGFVVTAVRRPAYALLGATAVLLTVFFAASYDNAAIERYYLGPILFAWTWLALLVGTAADLLAGLRGDPDWRAWTPSEARLEVGRRMAVVALGVAVLLGPGLMDFNDRRRDADRTRDRAATRWLDALAARVEPNAVILSWWSYSTTLWYGQLIEERFPDIEIIDDRTRLDEELGSLADVIEEHLGDRPVYVIRHDDLEEVERDYVVEAIPMPMPDGLGRVVGRQEEGS
jgi:hypothetical protein